jgi:xylulokinase
MFLGVDLGTSSIKLLLADQNGNIIDSALETYSGNYPQPNWSEQNPIDCWNGFCICLPNFGERNNLKQIETLSVSG